MTAKCLRSVQSRADLLPYQYPSGNADRSVVSLILPPSKSPIYFCQLREEAILQLSHELA